MSVNATNFVSDGFNIRHYVKMSFCRSYPTSQPFKRCRHKMLIASLCAFYAEDSLFEEKFGAIHIFRFYETDLS